MKRIEGAKGHYRIVLLLNLFDYIEYSHKGKTEAFRKLDIIGRTAREENDPLLEEYVQFARDSYEKNNNALSNTQKAAFFVRLSKKADNIQIAGVAHHFAGLYYYLAEEYGKAFEYLIDANGKFQEVGYRNVPGINRYLYELGTIYYNFKEYSKAIDILKEGLRYPAFNSHVAKDHPNALALSYMHKNELENEQDARNAEKYFLLALKVSAEEKNTFWIGLVNGNLSKIYQHQHRYREAIRTLTNEYNIGMQLSLKNALPDFAALDLSKCYLMMNKPDSCAYFLADSRKLFLLNNQGENDLKKLENERYLRNYSDVARLYYQKVKNWPAAYLYLDSMAVLEKRINKRYNSEQISLVEQRLMIQKHQNELTDLAEQQRSQRLRFIMAAIVLTLIAVLFWRLYLSSKRQRRQESIINSEREKSLKLEKQIVEKELDRAKHDLSVFMENLQERNSLIDSITAQLQANVLNQTKTSGDEQDNTVALIRELTNTAILTSEDWEEFRMRFERVYPDFLAQLHVKLNSLTPAEERIIALSKLNIDTRQMSRILGISAGTVRTTKYRLRKRLDENEQSLLSELLNS